MDTSDIQKGLKIILNDEPHAVIDFQFVKPGKSQAFTRTKLKNMLTGQVSEQTWKSGEKLEPADVEERNLQYVYPEETDFVFMDTNSGEQLSVSVDKVGEDSRWLSDGLMVGVTLFKGRPISISLPNQVVLQIVSLEPTDDSQPTQQAIVSTSATLAVPKLLKVDDWIKIDTTTGTYLEHIAKR